VEGIERVLETTASDSHHASRLVGEPEDARRVLLLVICADRGLCGGYNALAFRTAERVIHTGEGEQKTFQLYTVGKKARSFFKFRHREVRESFIGMADRPTFDDARRVAKAVLSSFLAEDVDVVELVSWRFHSAGIQAIEARRILPLPARDIPDHVSQGAQAQLQSESNDAKGFFDFEPDAEDLLRLVVPTYAESAIYQALLEASASEHTARQRAMAAATENAEEFITTLRRVMNRVRQEAITTEIMEIIGGAEALRHSAASNDVDIDANNHEEHIA
jgi:F-type H+-transporting ATPase subunit gamma